jgi:hypothetical protein
MQASNKYLAYLRYSFCNDRMGIAWLPELQSKLSSTWGWDGIPDSQLAF